MIVAQLKHVEKQYDRTPVLRDVSLTLKAGELVALEGRSGSGKSSLLNILGGLDRRFVGEAEVLGHPLHALGERGLARYRAQEVGFVFQSFHLLDQLTCLENVALPAHFAPGRKRTADTGTRATWALERVGMAAFAGRRPAELSGGQKQRVAIARALYGEPRLLLADEPTGNLDVDTGREIIALFETLHHEGLTQVIVTHEERVARAAGRVLRLTDGVLSE